MPKEVPNDFTEFVGKMILCIKHELEIQKENKVLLTHRDYHKKLSKSLKEQNRK